MNKKHQFADPLRYLIRIEGNLDRSTNDMLENYLIKKPLLKLSGTTSFIDGIVKDQAALNGLLNELYNGHYVILSVQQFENQIGLVMTS